jgi:PRC-barrel domain protein
MDPGNTPYPLCARYGIFKGSSEKSMLQNTQELYGRKLAALDGDIGHVKDFYFDDQAWAIRYVVVDTGAWLTGRLVLLSPHAFEKLDQQEGALRVKLHKKQIQDSPSIASHETVSQQFEEQYYRSYGWPVYWQGGEMWGMTGEPLGLAPLPRDPAVRRALEPRADRHLQSTKTVTGYHIEAVDGTIGHVAGFQVNPRSWAIGELIVETGHWHFGKQILVAPSKIERINFVEKKVVVKLTKADIQQATS